MVLDRFFGTKNFEGITFAGFLEKIKLHHRDDDLRQGVVRTFVLFECRRSQIRKTGETIQGDMSSNHTTTWHIPRRELERHGITHINAGDEIEQLEGPEKGRRWQPESDTLITEKLLGNHLDLDCKRSDQPTG
jgi:hypothetical protein